MQSLLDPARACFRRGSTGVDLEVMALAGVDSVILPAHRSDYPVAALPLPARMSLELGSPTQYLAPPEWSK
jgi:hypothetical protein